MNRTINGITAALILALAVFIKLSDFTIIEQLQHRIFDQFQVAKPRKYKDLPVRIIDIDDESLAKLGQWPWPRTKVAELLDKLSKAGVAAVGFDIVFAESDRTSPRLLAKLWPENKAIQKAAEELPDHDEVLAKSITAANVATGFVLTDRATVERPEAKAGFSFAGSDPRPYLNEFSGAVLTIPALEKVAKANGALNSIPESDGILRRMPIAFVLGGKFYPSLSSELLRIAQGASGYVIKSAGASGEESFGQKTGIVAVKTGEFEIPTDSSGKFWIYYTPYVSERYIPVWKVLQDDFDASQLEGMIVIIGTSAAGLKDIRATPLNRIANGVEVHAQAIEQVLSGEFLNRPDWIKGAEILMMAAVGVVVILTSLYLSAIWNFIATFAAIGWSFWFSWNSFATEGMLIDPVTPSIAILMVYMYLNLARFMSAEKEKAHIRKAFSQYMSPALVEQLARSKGGLTLGGQSKELSIMFSDIRDFTGIAEQFDAVGLTNFINGFLTPMTDVILKNHGTIDKYIGDCIMAFWNAPLDDGEHAKNSCRAALGMLKALDAMNAENKKQADEKQKYYVPIKVGIGINTGMVCVGNMGSEQRFDYSVLGDDVNLASRLEGQGKTYGVNIIIGEHTAQSASDFASIELDFIRVKGKHKPVAIYALVGDEELGKTEQFAKFKVTFSEMLRNYRDGKWNEALAGISALKAAYSEVGGMQMKKLYEMYKSRINELMANPPEYWDAVYVAETK